MVTLHRTGGPPELRIATPTADSGIRSSIQACRSHTFMEIDHEIISMVIPLPLVIQEGLLSVTA